jgi:hypothetical protein
VALPNDPDDPTEGSEDEPSQEEPCQDEASHEALEAQSNDRTYESLDGVLDLLVQEVERLQLALETYRLSDHPDKQALIRWHVQQIDMRQDRLEELKQMILQNNDGAVH